MFDFRVGQAVGYSFGISDNDEYRWAPERGSVGKITKDGGGCAYVEWNKPLPRYKHTNGAFYLHSRLYPVVSMGGF